MRRRPSKLLTATAGVIVAVPVVAGCEARVYGDTATSAGPQLTVVAPMGTKAPQPEYPPDEATASFDGLATRAKQATAEAAKAGADITTTILDRNTGHVVSNGNDDQNADGVEKARPMTDADHVRSHPAVQDA